MPDLQLREDHFVTLVTGTDKVYAGISDPLNSPQLEIDVEPGTFDSEGHIVNWTLLEATWYICHGCTH